MPDVNEDMDELFKKAGENYPLNTQSGDWNEVRNALKPVHSNLHNKKDKRRYLPLLWFLLPFIFIINRYVINPTEQKFSVKTLSGIDSNNATKQNTPIELNKSMAVKKTKK